MSDFFLKNIFSGWRSVSPVSYGLAAVLLFFTVGLGYFTEQNNTARFFWLSVPFFSLFIFINLWETKKEEIWFYIGVAVLLRAVLLFAAPGLSDDVYRFLWDGYLLQAGVSPFEHLPSFYAEAGFPIAGHSAELYAELNSPNYYTIYPPVAQFTFLVSVLFDTHILPGAAVILLRLPILLCEIGSIYLLVRLLQHFRYPLKNIYLYALNPLIIIELTGNLHFEGVMIFFFLLAFYFLVKHKKMWQSAVFAALSIASKLLPLLFLSFFIRRLGWKKSLLYFTIVGSVLVLLFAPITGSFFVAHFGESLDLYFRKFEFNASIYYLVRAVGYEIYGYNIIQKVGPWFAALTFFSIFIAAFSEKKSDWKSLPRVLLFAICVYLLFATTVHPWYVALPLVLCLFTRFRFPVLWSGVVWLTYANYGGAVYEEKMWAVVIEYSLVIGYAIWELFLMHGRGKTVYEIDAVTA